MRVKYAAVQAQPMESDLVIFRRLHGPTREHELDQTDDTDHLPWKIYIIKWELTTDDLSYVCKFC